MNDPAACVQHGAGALARHNAGGRPTEAASSQGPDIAIHHPESVLSSMNAWSQDQHERSGLIQKCRDSSVSVQARAPPQTLVVP